jgi:hypothetical protein
MDARGLREVGMCLRGVFWRRMAMNRAQVTPAPTNAGLEFSQGKEPNRRYRLDLAERPDGEASDEHRRGEGASPAQHAV